MKKKLRSILFLTLFLSIAAGLPVQAKQFRAATREAQRVGDYMFWIDASQELHIVKIRGKFRKKIVSSCSGAVFDGRVVYYASNSECSVIVRYSMQDQVGRAVAALMDVYGIGGVYKNKLVLSGNRENDNCSVWHIYTYDMNNWEIKKIMSHARCEGSYKQYILGVGLSDKGPGGLNLRVYNAKTKKEKMIINGTWCYLMDGKQVYYVKDMGSAGINYRDRKFQVYRYTLTNGKRKAMTKIITGISDDITLEKNRVSYRDLSGIKHTLQF